MTDAVLWLLIFGAGLITFLTRLSFIAAEGHYTPPSWFRRWMVFVPVAALTALTVPDLVFSRGELVIGTENRRLWAGLVAVVVAARWRNTLLTIASGFLALWLQRAFLG